MSRHMTDTTQTGNHRDKACHDMTQFRDIPDQNSVRSDLHVQIGVPSKSGVRTPVTLCRGNVQDG